MEQNAAASARVVSPRGSERLRQQAERYEAADNFQVATDQYQRAEKLRAIEKRRAADHMARESA